VTNPHKDVSISSSRFDIGSHSQQSLPADVPKLRRRKAQPQVFVFGGIPEVAKGFYIDGLDEGG
jgi:hypothetical protein